MHKSSRPSPGVTLLQNDFTSGAQAALTFATAASALATASLATCVWALTDQVANGRAEIRMPDRMTAILYPNFSMDELLTIACISNA
jgi:hypothetical protein